MYVLFSLKLLFETLLMPGRIQ